MSGGRGGTLPPCPASRGRRQQSGAGSAQSPRPGGTGAPGRGNGAGVNSGALRGDGGREGERAEEGKGSRRALGADPAGSGEDPGAPLPSPAPAAAAPGSGGGREPPRLPSPPPHPRLFLTAASKRQEARSLTAPGNSAPPLRDIHHLSALPSPVPSPENIRAPRVPKSEAKGLGCLLREPFCPLGASG